MNSTPGDSPVQATAGQVLDPPARIAVIGTGVMGASMARRLLSAGYRVTVFNRTAAKTTPLADAGATVAGSAAEAAAGADAVISIVGLPEDVRAVYLGEHGMLAAAQAGCLFIDMTTSEPGLAIELYDRAKARDLDVIDAPVSGGDIGARDGTLSIMMGGDPAAVSRAQPLLGHLGRTIVHQGPAGSGQRAKLANQIAIASTVLGVMEALAYARRAGLDPDKLLSSIGAGAAGSWAMTNLFPRAARGDFAPGFAIRHFRKDMRIAAQDAASLQLDLPGLELADSLYGRIEASGGGDLGTQALLTLLESAAG